jgi:hypothetical protein
MNIAQRLHEWRTRHDLLSEQIRRVCQASA